MNKQKLAKKMNQADFLYLTSFNNISGWYPVKLFDYAKLKDKEYDVNLNGGVIVMFTKL